MTEKEVLNAIKVACQLEKSQNAFAKKINISQTAINKIVNGKSKIGNISVETLMKIFPNMEIDFFSSKNTDNSVVGKINKFIAKLSEDQQLEVLLMLGAEFPEIVKGNKEKENDALEKTA
ncbi:helix-turn-helix transcriptional regulator [Lentisphaerota bacterium WC36G]|nr:helix-turn-helix transcriptional regulator [Lentisphaerae bacterium WC36]